MRIFRLLALVSLAIGCLAIPVSNAGVIGFATGHPEEEELSRFDEFLDYLERSTGQKFVMHFGEPSEIRTQILNGELDLAIISAFNYVLLTDEDVDHSVTLIARFEKFHEQFYDTNLVVNREMYNTDDDLVDLTFLYPDESSTSGYIVPRAMLSKRGVSLKDLAFEREPEGKMAILRRIASGERVFGAASSTTFQKAMRSEDELGNLFRLSTSDKVMPYDAIVLRRDSKFRSGLAKATSYLFLDDLVGDVAGILPKIGNLTGIRPALDRDYDGLRKHLARSERGRVIRVGLSLVLGPNTVHEKLQRFRPLQMSLFRNNRLFLEFEIYSREREQETLNDLIDGRLDLAELAPIAAGAALTQGAEALVAPTYDRMSDYAAVLIRSKERRTELRRGSDLEGKTIAFGSEQSASAHVYPRKYIEDEFDLSEDDYVAKNGLPWGASDL